MFGHPLLRRSPHKSLDLVCRCAPSPSVPTFDPKHRYHHHRNHHNLSRRPERATADSVEAECASSLERSCTSLIMLNNILRQQHTIELRNSPIAPTRQSNLASRNREWRRLLAVSHFRRYIDFPVQRMWEMSVAMLITPISSPGSYHAVPCRCRLLSHNHHTLSRWTPASRGPTSTITPYCNPI
jgi:hypothetical protein